MKIKIEIVIKVMTSKEIKLRRFVYYLFSQKKFIRKYGATSMVYFAVKIYNIINVWVLAYFINIIYQKNARQDRYEINK